MTNHEEQNDRESLRSVLHQVLVAREEEKREAALALHDEIAQNLALISLHLSVMRKQYALNPAVASQVVPEVQGIIAATQEKVRGLEFGLYPKVIELSIIDAVRGLLQRLTKDQGYSIEYLSPPTIRCERRTAIGLYRVIEGIFARSGLSQSAAWCVILRELEGGIEVSVARSSAGEVDNVSLVIDPLTRETIRAYGGRYLSASQPNRIEVVFPAG